MLSSGWRTMDDPRRQGDPKRIYLQAGHEHERTWCVDQIDDDDAVYTLDQNHKVLDALGHFAYALLCLGCLLVAFKMWQGWVLYILGDVMWVWLGWKLRLSSVVVWQFMFIGTALYGLWTWA